MFIEAVIGSFVGAALACPNVAGTIEVSTNKITTKLSDISDKLDGMNNTLTDIKSKISDIDIEQARMFQAFQWHDLVQTLMAKNAVYRGNNILELKENDSVIQLNLVERSITETKFGKTYVKTFDGCEYIDGKLVHSKSEFYEHWFDLEGNCIHEIDMNGKETWYEYDTSNRCIHTKVEHGKDYEEQWWEFDAEGNVIRHRVKRKLIKYWRGLYTYDYAKRSKDESILKYGDEVLNERLVEYGNIIHLVSKINESPNVECYATKDLVTNPEHNTWLHNFMDGYCGWYHSVEDSLIYYKCGSLEIGGGIIHDKNIRFDSNDRRIETDIWKDANGTIEKGFFNFLTHTYDKRIAIAKQKLEEAKAIITNSI